MEMNEKMEMNENEVCGVITVRRDHFLLIHDYFAMVLNNAQKLADESKRMGTPLSREECAGRLMMVAMIQMEEFKEQNPDAIEEMIVAAHMQEDAANRVVSHANDAMYG